MAVARPVVFTFTLKLRCSELVVSLSAMIIANVDFTLLPTESAGLVRPGRVKICLRELLWCFGCWREVLC